METIKISSILVVIVLILSACAQPVTPSADMISTAIAKTMAAQPPTNTVQPAATSTKQPINTPAPTNTPEPSNTPAPANTETPTSTTTQEPIGEQIAKNNVAVLDSGGVKIEVARIVVGKKEAVKQKFTMIDLFSDKTTVAEFVFKITNTTDKAVKLYVDQGAVAINTEQIDLFDYSMGGAKFGDDLGGEYLPGVTAIGGLWVGIKRTEYDKVTKIQIKIGAPYDANYSKLGPDYIFNIDVKDWTFEPLPDDLK
jgi:hypothetical protein